MPKWDLEWGRQQCLFRAAPQGIIANPNSGLYEKVKNWPAYVDRHLDPRLVKRRLAQLLPSYAARPVEPDQVENLNVELRTLAGDDGSLYIETMLYPTAFLCNRCGYIVAEPPGKSSKDIGEATDALAKKLPDDHACPRNGCTGRLRQWNYQTIHSCGEEIHLPTDWRVKCEKHGFSFLHFDRHNSERTADWEFVCKATGCPHRRKLYFTHSNCPLQGKSNLTPKEEQRAMWFSTTPIQKATNFIPKVISILNSGVSDTPPPAGTKHARAVAAGALRASQLFQGFQLDAGPQYWMDHFEPGQFKGDPNQAENLLKMAEATGNQELVRELKKTLGLDKPDQGLLTAPGFGKLTENDDYLEQAMSVALYNHRRRSRGIDDLLASADVHADTKVGLSDARSSFKTLGIHTVRYVESLALTSCLVGYTRGDYEANKVKLMLYARSTKVGTKYEVYTNTVTTEGIFIQLDPTRTLEWLAAKTGEVVQSSGDFTTDLFELQKRFLPESVPPFEPPQDRWSGFHYALLHTTSHLLVKNFAKQNSGLEQEGISEEIYPYQNGILLYSNQSTDFNLQGLELAFEHALQQVLNGMVEDAETCPYNPECQNQQGACHGCVHIAEFSCEKFNRVLDRRVLTAQTGGFWK